MSNLTSGDKRPLGQSLMNALYHIFSSSAETKQQTDPQRSRERESGGAGGKREIRFDYTHLVTHSRFLLLSLSISPPPLSLSISVSGRLLTSCHLNQVL